MSYVNTPFYKGEFYPAIKFPIGTLSTRLSKFINLVRIRKKFICINVCCGIEAAQYIVFNSNMVALDEETIDDIKGNIYFHYECYWFGNPLFYIELLNKSGISCVFDGDKQKPIIIVPDYFDFDFYKNV